MKWIDEVLELALTHMPAPGAATTEAAAAAKARSRRGAKRGGKTLRAH
ncbi:MAG TPA: hypothetical protein VLT59_06475 [Steroidobacteraceae bacterium]|nr:hypothetical protein [Steroidobacteraceae bacterium]